MTLLFSYHPVLREHKIYMVILMELTLYYANLNPKRTNNSTPLVFNHRSVMAVCEVSVPRGNFLLEKVLHRLSLLIRFPLRCAYPGHEGVSRGKILFGDTKHDGN